MRTAGTFVACLVTVLLFSMVSAAQEKEAPVAPVAPPTPDQVTSGEIRVTLSSDYAKLLVDGEAWEESEFLNSGFLLVIHAMNRTEEHRVLLTPASSGLAPVELVIKSDEWKLATVAKNEKMWRVERKVVFAKALPKPAPKTDTVPAAQVP